MTKNIIINIKNSLKKYIGEFLKYIYTERCLCCNSKHEETKNPDDNNSLLCKTCLKAVEKTESFAHAVEDGVEIYSATLYKGTIKELHHKLKFGHKKDVARFMAKILSDYLMQMNMPKNTIIVTIPTHNKNINIRGYDNVGQIAKHLCILNNMALSRNLVLKVKHNKPQYGLKREERYKNVKDCFSVNMKNYSGETILLIDDIYTTGATIKEAIKTLKSNKIDKIICLTVSKGT